MLKRVLFVAVAVLVIDTAAYSVWRTAAFISAGRQIANMERGRTCVRYVESYKEHHQRYPDRLNQAIPRNRGDLARDVWGNGFKYATNGSAFILVSLGSDGEPDRDVRDYW